MLVAEMLGSRGAVVLFVVWFCRVRLYCATKVIHTTNSHNQHNHKWEACGPTFLTTSAEQHSCSIQLKIPFHSNDYTLEFWIDGLLPWTVIGWGTTVHWEHFGSVRALTSWEHDGLSCKRDPTHLFRVRAFYRSLRRRRVEHFKSVSSSNVTFFPIRAVLKTKSLVRVKRWRRVKMTELQYPRRFRT